MQIDLKSKIVNDEYTEYVYSAFDIQDTEYSKVTINVDFSDISDKPWNIGVIIGGSGSGKSTILNQILKPKTVIFSHDKALISNFNFLPPIAASKVLTSMGLSSVPTWLRPFHTLSNGEQYRATLAYLVASAKTGEVILVDEYTSVVDRDVAKAMSFALQKYIRREGKNIILASCHYDILEWLMPDWICSPQKGGVLEWCDYLRQGRPQIELSVSRCEAETWNFFKKHHYLTEKVGSSNSFFLFEWNQKPVGIVATSPLPSGTLTNAYRLSRTVVLPDYQGLGIGKSISEFICGILKNKGCRIFTKTVNPALGEYRDKTENRWTKTAKHGRKLNPKGMNHSLKKWDVKNRASYCHEYVGDEIDGYEELLVPIKDIRKK